MCEYLGKQPFDNKRPDSNDKIVDPPIVELDRLQYILYIFMLNVTVAYILQVHICHKYIIYATITRLTLPICIFYNSDTKSRIGSI